MFALQNLNLIADKYGSDIIKIPDFNLIREDLHDNKDFKIKEGVDFLFQLLNNVPQMSMLAKYSIFPSSSYPVKKLPELDAVCFELAQTVQSIKEVKNEKFLDYLTNIRNEVGVKAFEWLHFEDPAVNLIKGKKRASVDGGSSNNCNKKIGTVTSLNESNSKIANNEKYVSTEHNCPNVSINSIDIFEESRFSNSLSVIDDNKRPFSAISHFISLKNISNQQNMYNNGFLYRSPPGLQFNTNSAHFQGQKRSFKTKRQIQMELDKSFLGLLKRLTDVFGEKKTDNLDFSRKESPVSDLSNENLQTSNKKTGSSGSFQYSNALLKFCADMLRLAFWFACLVLLFEVYRTAYSSDKFALTHIPETVTVTFDDAKGMDEAKAELKCVVEFLRDPSKFMYLGGKLPSGILLQGPPGTGKTLLARAVAGEANVQFFHISGSEFDEILVGEGARRVRNLFNAARKRAPAVIFIDEIDAVGGRRVSTSMHPFANQTIIQLLAEMDGFVQNEKIVVIGATNRESDLDEALLRPGRFDLKIQLFKPDIKGRREILKLHLNKIVSKDIDIEFIAKRTVGFSGADLENLVNQAALSAATDGRDFVTTDYMERALEKIMLGPAMRSLVQSEHTKMITAYHESGHAIVAHFTPGARPLVKATIVPHGQSLGHISLLNEDRLNYSKSELLAIIDVKMGGRVAEELIFGSDKVTTGCEHDLEAATTLASNMVRHWGMSDKVGLRTLKKYSGRGYETKEWGHAAGDEIDQEIKKIIQESYERVKKLLKKHEKEHKLLAEKLLENETLDADEIKELFGQGREEDGSDKGEV